MKLQREMAQSMEDLLTRFEIMSKQFEGFRKMMQNTLDSLNAMGSWQAFMDKVFRNLHERAEGMKASLDAVYTWIDFTASRVNSLEVRMTIAPAPPSSMQPQPALRNMDLNAAPESSSCSPAMDRERAKGHGKHCGRILGLQP
jgi:hypothetical protein